MQNLSFPERFFFYLLLLVILIYPFQVGGTTFPAEVLNVLVLALSFLFLTCNAFSKAIEKTRISFNVWIFICIFLTFSLVFSLITIINSGDVTQIKDVLEPLKPAVFSVLFLTGAILAYRVRTTDIGLLVVYFLATASLISMMTYVPFLDEFAKLYKGRYLETSIHYFRAAGVFGFPATFGYWLSFGVFLLLSFPEKSVSSLFKYALVSLFFITLVATGSRATLIIFIVNIFFYLFFFRKKPSFGAFSIEKEKLYLSVLFITIAIIFFFLFSNNPAVVYLTSILKMESLEATTFSQRSRELTYLVSAISRGDVFGLGPANSEISDITSTIETAYFYYGVKFGIPGLLYYLTLIVISVWFGFFSQHSVNKPIEQMFFIWSSIALFVGGFSNSVTEEFKSIVIFPLLFGFFLSKYFVRPRNHYPPEYYYGGFWINKSVSKTDFSHTATNSWVTS